MSELIAVALGGAVGALGRVGLSNLATVLWGEDFPWGILIVNVLGSLAIGVLFVLLVERALLPQFWRSLLIVGFLGAFTTFSTFSLQTLGLIEAGRMMAAGGYVLSSVFACLAATAAGMALARLLP